MKNIFVVGGNGFAKECYQMLCLLAKEDPEIRFAGFLGHNGYKVDFKDLNKFFIEDLSLFTFGTNDYAVIGAGSPLLREKIYLDILKKKNAKFINLYLPSNTYISEYVELGEGNIFAPPCLPSVHIKIGNANLFNGEVVVGHDVEIGDYNFFGPKSQVLGDCKIGHSNSIGAGSVILAKAKIGDNNTIAPLSAVYKGCKHGEYLIGNPAEKL